MTPMISSIKMIYLQRLQTEETFSEISVIRVAGIWRKILPPGPSVSDEDNDNLVTSFHVT